MARSRAGLEYAFPARPAIDHLGIPPYRRDSLHHIDVIVLKAMVLQDFVHTGANRVAQEMRHAMRKNLNRFSSRHYGLHGLLAPLLVGRQKASANDGADV